jgi:hypothetical protein
MRKHYALLPTLSFPVYHCIIIILVCLLTTRSYDGLPFIHNRSSDSTAKALSLHLVEPQL